MASPEVIVCPRLIFRSIILQFCFRFQRFKLALAVGIMGVELASRDSAIELEDSEIVVIRWVGLVSTVPYLEVSFVFGLVAVFAFELGVIVIEAISGSAVASTSTVA